MSAMSALCVVMFASVACGQGTKLPDPRDPDPVPPPKVDRVMENLWWDPDPDPDDVDTSADCYDDCDDAYTDCTVACDGDLRCWSPCNDQWADCYDLCTITYCEAPDCWEEPVGPWPNRTSCVGACDDAATDCSDCCWDKWAEGPTYPLGSCLVSCSDGLGDCLSGCPGPIPIE
jgi:hypothetical protein